MSLVDTEQVLVVPTKLIHRLGYFQGFTTAVGSYLDELLSPENISYRPRHEMEHDPSFKQLIPYVIFRTFAPDGAPLIFQYTRGTGQGESRLHAKRSVGIGGHICLDDQTNGSALNPYQEGLRRELAEEVEIGTPYRDRLVGLINDDESEVGRVHLGVVHLFEAEHAAVTPRERDITNAGFLPLTKLLADLDGFESWSRICLQALFGRQ
jgi:predicted NUDIX family phosphoesterase